ncbi:MAG TPA: hypothetical protein VN635_04130 [Conexibacter sp.]|nr:hypothetical protein [Conexibacter sp.]
MRYHAEIRRGFRVARELNLDEPALRARVLAPWARGALVVLGGREWEPAHCTLRVLAGPQLTAADLAMGQGWQNAERSGRDVTGELLATRSAPAAVALLAQTPAAAAAARGALERLGVSALAWEQAAGATAALVVFDGAAGDADARWWLEVGRALGALGARAVLAVHGGAALPGPLADAPALRLDDAEASAQALGERLR